jgi:hypothetical protein
VFVMGIGSMDFNELNGIASDPDSKHVQLLASFDDMPGFVDRLRLVTCEAPQLIVPGLPWADYLGILEGRRKELCHYGCHPNLKIRL